MEPETVSIDENWVCKATFLKTELITCPVCYTIPVNGPK